MHTSGAATRRCVVWFGQPDRAEQDALALAGWPVRVADAGSDGVGIRNGDIVVALADLRVDDRGVHEAMERMVAEHPGVPWIALVSPETPAREPTVKRVLRDCIDFFTSPIDTERLQQALARLSGSGRLRGGGPADIAGMVGESRVMHQLRATIRKYAPVDLPVLITGETGTGKEVAASALHRLSARAERPFVPINCGALPPNLVQSELFGHERGAFTGANARRVGHIESASGGTVFLDEIGDLPLDAQTSLLRFLQEGTFERLGSSQPIRADVRVLAATHVDLEKAVAEGRFREDLYYRLNVLRLPMPPLRERGGDVELLAQFFLEQFRQQHRTGQPVSFSASARRAMRAFAWPGNVRELLNRVQRAAVVAEGPLIDTADLDLPAQPAERSVAAGLGEARILAERDAILACLRETRFNISECARRLRISRVTVYRLCKKHRLALDELR
ncbi:sigma-54 dependent transcriptional regulator [Fulvimonas soli]|jgi:DNA-binding NtrC family response regulator|uniref:DNA-binding NtrC family response regulator n=1 Tax=Fulvimonas soli TaxID=155197 RepID=A0A316HZM9_9GAMM|nr:sigma-54 dependent transcriptional regulator [Fulvimonas soli]PWK86622.1 DNA-binding NtrC family response regulator [Fulvimonas soli]TNY25550.1 Fis family transcriptional regulator [Fulvimonas soli]